MRSIPRDPRNLSTSDLTRYAGAIARHAGRHRPWRERDAQVDAELRRRAWDYERLTRAPVWACPSWLYPLLVTPSGRHMGAWAAPLGAVWAAYRAGASGVALSWEDGAALYGCARRTWGRWVASWEAAGLVRPVRRYVGAAGELGRERAATVYQPGPAMLRASCGQGLAQSERTRARRQRAAMARAVAHRQARRWDAWVAVRRSQPSWGHRRRAVCVAAGRAAPATSGGVVTRGHHTPPLPSVGGGHAAVPRPAGESRAPRRAQGAPSQGATRPPGARAGGGGRPAAPPGHAKHGREHGRDVAGAWRELAGESGRGGDGARRAMGASASGAPERLRRPQAGGRELRGPPARGGPSQGARETEPVLEGVSGIALAELPAELRELAGAAWADLFGRPGQ